MGEEKILEKAQLNFYNESRNKNKFSLIENCLLAIALNKLTFQKIKQANKF